MAEKSKAEILRDQITGLIRNFLISAGGVTQEELTEMFGSPQHPAMGTPDLNIAAALARLPLTFC